MISLSRAASPHNIANEYECGSTKLVQRQLGLASRIDFPPLMLCPRKAARWLTSRDNANCSHAALTPTKACSNSSARVVWRSCSLKCGCASVNHKNDAHLLDPLSDVAGVGCTLEYYSSSEYQLCTKNKLQLWIRQWSKSWFDSAGHEKSLPLSGSQPKRQLLLFVQSMYRTWVWHCLHFINFINDLSKRPCRKAGKMNERTV